MAYHGKKIVLVRTGTIKKIVISAQWVGFRDYSHPNGTPRQRKNLLSREGADEIIKISKTIFWGSGYSIKSLNKSQIKRLIEEGFPPELFPPLPCLEI